MKKFFTSVFIFFAIFLFSITQSLAYSCPDYFFSTDLAKGTTNKDVRVIQEILNLDKRTIVTAAGPGSPSQETNYFGIATREALKRFQALFIEYIGIANGKFGPRTRTTMNAVCKGPFFTNGIGNVYDDASVNRDKIPPIIAVAGPTTAEVDTPFRAYVAGNEPIKTPDLTGLIIFGATASDMRKVSSTTFSFIVTPNQDANGYITLQFEAEKISDLAGNKNEKASNEWQIVVSGGATSTASSTFEMPLIEFPTISGNTDCSTVVSVDVSDYSNPCYGKAPMSYASQGYGGGDQGQQQQQQKKPSGAEQIMQMLQGLLKGLAGAGGGMEDGGGTGAGPGTCVCPGPLMGQPTIGLAGLAGPSGRFLETLNPGMGKYTGKLKMGPPGICGQMYSPKTGCINPMGDSTGMPVMGVIPADPIFKWAR